MVLKGSGQTLNSSMQRVDQWYFSAGDRACKCMSKQVSSHRESILSLTLALTWMIIYPTG